jgi:hypothetical protein
MIAARLFAPDFMSKPRSGLVLVRADLERLIERAHLRAEMQRRHA